MLRFLFGLVLVSLIAVVVMFMPLHGRTIAERWNAARTPGEFLERGYHEARASLAEPGRSHAQPARPPGPAARPRAAAPVERHTERDRAALDRIVADHVKR
jgi:hypothetical protein